MSERDKLRKRLADRQLSLEITTEAKNHLAAEGYDPQFGARPLKRVIQQRIENQIATRILVGEYQPDDTIVVAYAGKSFTFERRPGQGDGPVPSPRERVGSG